MSYLFDHPWEFGVALALVLAAFLELGRRVAAALQIEQVPQRKEQMGTIRDGMFVLVSLLLGFTLTMATSRYVERRSLLVDEAVAIESTYLRAITLPEPYRTRSHGLLRQYVDTRLRLDEIDFGEAGSNKVLEESRHLQEQLWHDAGEVAEKDRTAVTAAYLSALNQTIDLHQKRIASFENRIPVPVWLLILSVSVVAVFTRGSTLSSRFWLSLVLLPVTIALVVALIADLDSPARGLIRLDERAMQRLKANITSSPD